MTSGDTIAHLPVQQHDLLVRRVPGGRGSIQPETLERVVERRLANVDAGLAFQHPVVERHHILLRIRQPGVRADYQRHHGVPVGILAGVHVTAAVGPDAEDARQQEVLETHVGEAPGPRMPAEAVEIDGMRGDPTPVRGSGLKRVWYSTSGTCLVRIASMTLRSVWAPPPYAWALWSKAMSSDAMHG